jgi:hypothetical protein
MDESKAMSIHASRGITVDITAPATPDSIQDMPPIPLRRATPEPVLLLLLLVPPEGLAVPEEEDALGGITIS